MKLKRRDHEDVLSADAFDLGELREIVFGEGEEYKLPKALALSLLGRKTYPNKLDDLKSVLADKAQSPRVRHVAAVELGRHGSDEALGVLMSSLDVEEELVRRGVLDSLARLGGHEALDKLAEFKEELEDPTSRVSWTAAQIAYRLGVEGFEILYPTLEQLMEVDPDQAQPIEVGPADVDIVGQAIEDLSDSVLGITFSGELALAMKCGDSDLVFLFNEEVAEPQALSELLGKKTVLGVVAGRYGLEPEMWTARYYVLVRPSERENELEILLTTSNGTLASAGTATVEGEQAVVAVRTVQHPGAVPVEIEGVYGDGALYLERALSELHARGQLIPSPRKPSDR